MSTYCYVKHLMTPYNLELSVGGENAYYGEYE